MDWVSGSVIVDVPFCGGEAQFYQTHPHWTDWSPEKIQFPGEIISRSWFGNIWGFSQEELESVADLGSPYHLGHDTMTSTRKNIRKSKMIEWMSDSKKIKLHYIRTNFTFENIFHILKYYVKTIRCREQTIQNTVCLSSNATYCNFALFFYKTVAIILRGSDTAVAFYNCW